MSEQVVESVATLNGLIKGLIDIAIHLARGVSKHPYLSAIVLIFLLFDMGAIVTAEKEGLIFTFILAIVAMSFVLFIHQVGKRIQEEEVQELRDHMTATIDIGNNTINLADKLSASEKGSIRNLLQGAARDVADELKIPRNLVRSNLFGVDDHDQMKMPHDLTYNMDREEELGISMPVGYGSTGRCFERRMPNIAVFDEDWGKDSLQDKELRKVHPDLRWVISVPVPYKELGEEHPIWVLNVDGLRIGRSKEELLNASSQLANWSFYIYLFAVKASKTRMV